MSISTHILDTSRGTPAADVSITLDFLDSHPPHAWQTLGTAHTNADGRAPTLLPKDYPLKPGTYRLTFHTAPYFAAQKIDSFYPQVEIQFHIKDPAQHYHVPLLLSPFSYSTYRGS